MQPELMDPPTEIDMRGADELPDLQSEVDALKAELADLQFFRETAQTAIGWRVEFAELRKETEAAKVRLEECAEALKEAKIAMQAALQREYRMIEQFTTGQKLLPFDQVQAAASTQAPAEQKPATPAEQTAPETNAAPGRTPITVLLAKEIKKIIGADAFFAAKDAKDPVGLTEKSIDALIAKGWDTIEQLETAMRENDYWYKDISGFGQHKIDILVNTLHAFRRVHPQPDDPNPAEADETPPETMEARCARALASVEALITRANGALNDRATRDRLTMDGLEYINGVLEVCFDQRKSILETKIIADDEFTSIENWKTELENCLAPPVE